MPRRKQLKLSSPAEVRKALARIANMVINNELSNNTANTLIFACNAVLNSIRTDEQERKLVQLEHALTDRSY